MAAWRTLFLGLHSQSVAECGRDTKTSPLLEAKVASVSDFYSKTPCNTVAE